MPFMVMQHEVDPKQKLLDELGDISNVEIFNNQLLVAVYIRPKKTKSGIILADETVEPDQFQSKVGLVVKMGPDAFHDPDEKWFKGYRVGMHDWIVSRPSDGWSITVNNVLCRVVDDVNVRGRVDHPDRVW